MFTFINVWRQSFNKHLTGITLYSFSIEMRKTVGWSQSTESLVSGFILSESALILHWEQRRMTCKENYEWLNCSLSDVTKRLLLQFTTMVMSHLNALRQNRPRFRFRPIFKQIHTLCYKMEFQISIQELNLQHLQQLIAHTITQITQSSCVIYFSWYFCNNI